MDRDLNLIKQEVEKILEIIEISGEVEIETPHLSLGGGVETDQPEFIVVNIISPEASFLIGQGGTNLFALQHLVRVLIAKKTEGKLKEFVLDVNGYQRHRLELLKELALDKANQVIEEQGIIALQPMSSYERRIIHLTLFNHQGIICQSEGEGRERHIVIKPTP